jgi:hypothetical protein
MVEPIGAKCLQFPGHSLHGRGVALPEGGALRHRLVEEAPKWRKILFAACLSTKAPR